MICGKIVDLRPIEETDLEPLREMGNDDFISSKIVRQFFVTKNEMTQWYGKQHCDNESLYFTIVTHYDNFRGVAGMIGLRKVDWVNRKGELTMFLHPITHGKGFGTEALELFCRYCFQRINLHKIYMNVLDHNSAAIRTYEKAGFAVEGTLKDEVFMGGRYNNMKRMAIYE